jgi:DnaJ-class molecular chaperone
MEKHTELCSKCNGSGEGKADFSICYTCKGTGEVTYTDQQDDEDIDETRDDFDFRNDP